jgi:lipoprotein signal peptidase
MSRAYFNVVNKAMVFGMGPSGQLVIIGFMMFVFIFVFRTFEEFSKDVIAEKLGKADRVSLLVSKSMILAGGFGNILSRSTFGGVVDYFFIDRLWFNLNDVYVTAGAIILTAFIFKNWKILNLNR